MDNLFKNEQAAIDFIYKKLPTAISNDSVNNNWVNPFISDTAKNLVVFILGKALYDLQEKSKIATNKDI